VNIEHPLSLPVKVRSESKGVKIISKNRMYLTRLADLSEQEQFAALIERHERLRAIQRESLHQAFSQTS